MRFNDGTVLKSDDYLALSPRRIEKHKNYEIWQHPYYKDNYLENDPDIQLVYFNSDSSIDSYHVSSKKYRLKDSEHLGRLQLVYHDITLNFNEYTFLVKDIHSNETELYFQEIIFEKESRLLIIDDFFSYNSTYMLNPEEVHQILNEESILLAVDQVIEETDDDSNIYFRLLSQLNYLKDNYNEEYSTIAYVYYLIGYFVGLFLHPMSGDEIAIHYLNKAISLETNQVKKELYNKTIKMVNEEEI